MPRLVSVLVACAAVLRPARAPATGSMTVLFQDDFERGLSARWVERGFPSIARKNVFSRGVEPGGNHYLRVTSEDSYSGKGLYLRFSVERCPTVRWRWVVSNVVAAGDLRHRDGDDAAAKFYVVFAGPSWWNPLDKRVLVYLWDNAAAKGTILPNAWMPDRARMIVLESGRAAVGGWVTEHVDLAADFARAFPGERPGRVEGVAFLADTDNTHSQVWAGLDDLEIRCTRGGSGAPR
ncbi:MAG: DUF3047 domain-containing protein [Gemmatimonadaceae bacterium]|nr:DUF3047 domain-containing protein [Gemmatimonadaceae bacterium]